MLSGMMESSFFHITDNYFEKLEVADETTGDFAQINTWNES
jgi:hypothetical protein